MKNPAARFLAQAFLLICLVAVLVIATGRLAMAQVLWSDVGDVVAVEILPGWRAKDGTHVAGLRFRLEPGWKTYWRSAGAAGIAPRFDWEASENVADVTVAWPTPTVFRQGDVLSIGYDTDFILPLVIHPRRPGERIALSGQLDIGVCADICLPARMVIEGALPSPGAADPVLLAAMADQPEVVVTDARCSLRPTPDGAALTGHMDLPPLGGSEAVVFEVPDPRLWVTDANVQRSGDRLIATSELMVGGGGAVSLDRQNVRITVIGAARAVEIRGCAR